MGLPSHRNVSHSTAFNAGLYLDMICNTKALQNQFRKFIITPAPLHLSTWHGLLRVVSKVSIRRNRLKNTHTPQYKNLTGAQVILCILYKPVNHKEITIWPTTSCWLKTNSCTLRIYRPTPPNTKQTQTTYNFQWQQKHTYYFHTGAWQGCWQWC